MKERHIKVYSSSGTAQVVPKIMLQGKWLIDAGYKIGDQIKVSCQDNKLIIELEKQDDH